MLPRPEELAELVRGNIIERYWPTNRQDEDAIESHILAIVDSLRGLSSLAVEAEFNHYGCGFASYVHVFCAKSNRPSTTRHGETDYIDGIALYLGRLVPFAAYGAEARTKSPGSGSGGFLDCKNLEVLPNSSWDDELQDILAVVNAYGFMVLPKSEYCRQLPVQLEWETNFGTETYFDAIFYWFD